VTRDAISLTEARFMERFTPPPPSAAARQGGWPGGVVHSREGGKEAFDIPGTAPGVASRFEVQGGGWFRPPTVTATDALGNPLEAHAEREGRHDVLVASDPTSGLETRLDPRAHRIDVSTRPREVEIPTTAPFAQSAWVRRNEAHQVVDAAGNTWFFAHEEQYVEHFTAGAGRVDATLEGMVFPARGGRPRGMDLTGYGQLTAGQPFLYDFSPGEQGQVSLPDADGGFTYVSRSMDDETLVRHPHQLFIRPASES